MTTHQSKRCAHCLAHYYYQGSGYGCNDSLNDPTYCPECKRAVQVALAAIPRKFEQVWVDTSEVSLALLLEWEAAHEQEMQARGGLQVRRVAVPLFRLDNGTTSKQAYVKGRDNYRGRLYLYQYWEGEEDKAEIRIEMEKDLTTGKLIPW